ncbi:hypothetical protein [Vibrio aerogenes]|uniref:hypothetical protein n=1 Tax=Vibrio aerogenes TaxID=92172 RepID=UPI0009375687|nr:hypothetical protein [Vibrio aerogenes]
MGIDANLAHLNASGNNSSSKGKNQPSDESDVYEQPPASQQNNDLPSDWCNHVFGSFLSIYETQWEYQYGSLPTGRFIEFSEAIDAEKLNRLLKHCHERIQTGNSWPPQMGELWVLKDALTAEELLDSRIRVLSRMPASQIEKWLVQNKLFNLKHLAENKLDEQFKKYYLEAKRLQEKGLLHTEAPESSLLGNHSVKNLNDVMREAYEQKHGRQLHPRIRQIIDHNNDE